MIYERTFRFSASHFNSLKTYQHVWAMAEDGVVTLNVADFRALLRDVHGHNFKVVVTIEGQSINAKNPWLVDDIALAKIIKGWENTNLSMHPDFMGIRARATTELMANILYTKINMFLSGDQGPTDPPDCVIVRVYETDDIYAEES